MSEIVRPYGLRNWVEQSYKRVLDELGWADFMVRSDRAIRSHWAIVCCAFAFCWWHAAGQSHPSDSFTPPVDTPITPPEAGVKTSSAKALPCWPRLLRTVRAWLTPAYWLARCWAAFASAPSRAELAALLGALNAGHGINLYLRIQQTTASCSQAGLSSSSYCFCSIASDFPPS